MRATTIALFATLLVPGCAAAQEAGAMPDFDSIWDGVYLGLNGGYVMGSATDNTALFPATPYSGYLAGGQVGYDMAIDALVLGVQADVDWSDAIATSTDIASGPGGIYHMKSVDDLLWTGALTGHVGVAMGPVMPYALGGVVFAGNKITQSGNDINGVFEATQQSTLTGWTAGGGLSAMLGNVSSFVEYRYSSYLPATYKDLITQSPIGLADSSVRAGLNIHVN